MMPMGLIFALFIALGVSAAPAPPEPAAGVALKQASRADVIRRAELHERAALQRRQRGATAGTASSKPYPACSGAPYASYGFAKYAGWHDTVTETNVTITAASTESLCLKGCAADANRCSAVNYYQVDRRGHTVCSEQTQVLSNVSSHSYWGGSGSLFVRGKCSDYRELVATDMDAVCCNT